MYTYRAKPVLGSTVRTLRNVPRVPIRHKPLRGASAMTSSNTPAPSDAPKPRLLEQVRNCCRVRHMALKTEYTYVGWIRRFILFHGKRHPLEMGDKEVTEFLTHLAVAGHVAASTQNQALSALLFLYRAVLQREFGWLNDVVRAKKPKGNKRGRTIFRVKVAPRLNGRSTRCTDRTPARASSRAVRAARRSFRCCPQSAPPARPDRGGYWRCSGWWE